jgi:hypothetical protein
MPLQTSVLVGAENLTNNIRANNEEPRIYVPPTISNESQKIRMLKNMTEAYFDPSDQKTHMFRFLKRASELLVMEELTAATSDC